MPGPGVRPSATDEDGEGLDLLFAALADPTRRRLVTRLAREGPRTATALARDLPMSRQAVVHHLQTMADAGLVEARRVGREVLWTATAGALAGPAAWLDAARSTPHPGPNTR